MRLNTQACVDLLWHHASKGQVSTNLVQNENTVFMLNKRKTQIKALHGPKYVSAFHLIRISHFFYLNLSNFLLVFQEQSEDDCQSPGGHPIPAVTQNNIFKEINIISICIEFPIVFVQIANNFF